MDTEVIEVEFLYTTEHILRGSRTARTTATIGTVPVAVRHCRRDAMDLVMRSAGEGFPEESTPDARYRWLAERGRDTRMFEDEYMAEQTGRIRPGRLEAILNNFGPSPLLRTQLGCYADSHPFDIRLPSEIDGHFTGDDRDERAALVLAAAHGLTLADERLWVNVGEPIWLVTTGADLSVNVEAWHARGPLPARRSIERIFGAADLSEANRVAADLARGMSRAKFAHSWTLRRVHKDSLEIARPDLLGRAAPAADLMLALNRMLRLSAILQNYGTGPYRDRLKALVDKTSVWDPVSGATEAAIRDLFGAASSLQLESQCIRPAVERLATWEAWKAAAPVLATPGMR